MGLEGGGVGVRAEHLLDQEAVFGLLGQSVLRGDVVLPVSLQRGTEKSRKEAQVPSEVRVQLRGRQLFITRLWRVQAAKCSSSQVHRRYLHAGGNPLGKARDVTGTSVTQRFCARERLFYKFSPP